MFSKYNITHVFYIYNFISKKFYEAYFDTQLIP